MFFDDEKPNTVGLDMANDSTVTFPTEIFISIIDHVESIDELLVLARVSHGFNEIALNALFERYGVDPHGESISLTLPVAGANLVLLEAFSLSLGVVGNTPEELNYDCGFTNVPQLLIRELRLLTRYIIKLTSVNRVSLRISSPPWLKNPEWNSASTDLLLAVLEKGCEEIHITTTQLSSVHPHENSLSPAAAASGSISVTPSDWMKKYLPISADDMHQHRMLTSTANEISICHLQRCTIQTFPHFLRPFYFISLRANAQLLTHISFKNIFGGDADFAVLLNSLYLPHLTHFGLKYGVVRRDAIALFILSHPHILSLEYHHLRYPSSNLVPRPLPGSACGQLTSLTTSPEHILKLLPPASDMPFLKKITIKVENHNIVRFQALEEALWHLSSCVGPLSLTLQVTVLGLGFGVWLDGIFTDQISLDPSTRPEARLRGVRSLTLDNGGWALSDQFLSRIPAWASLFPDLTELTVRSESGETKSRTRIQVSEEVFLSGTFSEKLKVKCPRLRTVSVINSVEWTHTYD